MAWLCTVAVGFLAVIFVILILAICTFTCWSAHMNLSFPHKVGAFPLFG